MWQHRQNAVKIHVREVKRPGVHIHLTLQHSAHFASDGDGGGGSTNICEKRPPPARF